MQKGTQFFISLAIVCLLLFPSLAEAKKLNVVTATTDMAALAQEVGGDHINVESIANKLALYGYYGQANEVYTYASWIDSTTINTNPTIGGGTDQPWYNINGVNVW